MSRWTEEHDKRWSETLARVRAERNAYTCQGESVERAPREGSTRIDTESEASGEVRSRKAEKEPREGLLIDINDTSVESQDSGYLGGQRYGALQERDKERIPSSGWVAMSPMPAWMEKEVVRIQEACKREESMPSEIEGGPEQSLNVGGYGTGGQPFRILSVDPETGSPSYKYGIDTPKRKPFPTILVRGTPEEPIASESARQPQRWPEYSRRSGTSRGPDQPRNLLSEESEVDEETLAFMAAYRSPPRKTTNLPEDARETPRIVRSI